MRKELEDKLAAEFPFMHRQAGLEGLYGELGCEFDDGWFEVIRGLCSDIVAAYEKAGMPIDFTVSQAKEKFGELRFYYSIGNDAFRIKPASDSTVYTELRCIVEKWQDISATICIKCGAPGVIRRDIGWVQPMCDTHHVEALMQDEAMKDPVYYRTHIEEWLKHLPDEERERLVNIICYLRDAKNQQNH
jgi:hypothetical protein